MQLILLSLLAAAAVTALDIGGPHGDYSLIKHDSVHRRHHYKRATTAKCKSKGKSKHKNKSPAAPAAPAASQGQGTGDSSSSDSGNSSSGGSSNSTSSDSGSSSSASSSASLSGITGFLGTNTGIGSWFRTDNSQDDTNGRSWCQLNYQDSWLGFAPDVSVMLSNFGGDTNTAGTHYCGLEAKATNPSNGKTALIYIVDGFDPAWVRTPGSIDLTLGAFAALYGSTTDDKNTVIQNLQWEFTGNRNSQYAFNAGG